MKKVKTMMGLAGFILLFGAAGASDLGTISFTQVCLQSLAGLIIMTGSFLLPKRGN